MKICRVIDGKPTIIELTAAELREIKHEFRSEEMRDTIARVWNQLHEREPGTYPAPTDHMLKEAEINWHYMIYDAINDVLEV